MKKEVTAFIFAAVLVLSLAGCGKARPVETAAPAAEPVVTAEVPAPAESDVQAPVQDAGQAAPAETAQPAARPARQDGERYETVIMLEGMEETVHYEHIRRDTLGFEMDYDYESFKRQSDPDRECFVSVWDNSPDPENYMELIHSTADAETVTAFIREKYSAEFDITETDVIRTLEGAGDCTRIEASVIKGTNNMAMHLQAAYIIPTPDGCIVATTHASADSAEGLWRRFDYMLHTLTVLDRGGERTLSDGQARSAVRDYCLAENPDLADIVNAGEYPVYWEITSSDADQVVILFRSYTGAQKRYYVNRSTGETYVTEFVPGITTEETRTEESLNVWDYLG